MIGVTDRDREVLARYSAATSADELRDALGDTWGERVLVLCYNGKPKEYFAAVPGSRHLRQAWPEFFNEPVWRHVNEVGYRLTQQYEPTSWELWDWDDAPVATDWEVIYP